MPEINGERLLADLHTLRSYGASGTGVVRLAFTDVDMESRRWLLRRMADAGLEARIDGVGNVFGRSPGDGPALLLGSHTDTQPRGGWLDGAMGVIYALETARAFRESDAARDLKVDNARDLKVDIASWMDEEGTYINCLGSRIFVGDITAADVADTKTETDERQSLAGAMASAGLDGKDPARLDPERHVAYLEAHVEQGGVLESENRRIGVVTAIVGIRNVQLVFEGAVNHAGTTPMPIRKDAGMALFNLAHDINARFNEITGERTVWTIGHVAFATASTSIIPGRTEMLLQFRDPETDVLDRFEAALQELIADANARGPVTVSAAPWGLHLRPAPMAAALQDHIVDAAEARAPGEWMRMPSGAGHDAQVFAERMPSAMLFVPSIGGISHDFAEDTKEEDIVLGCRVFADAAARILRASA